MTNITYTSNKDDIIDAAEEITDQLQGQVDSLKQERNALWIVVAVLVTTSYLF